MPDLVRLGIVLLAVQIVSGTGTHPLEIQACAKSSESTTPRPLEETPPHFRPWNRRHRSRIELGDPPLDLSRPRSLGVLVYEAIQAGEQRFSESRAVLCWERQCLLQNVCGVTFHASIVAVSPLPWLLSFTVREGEQGGGTETREHCSRWWDAVSTPSHCSAKSCNETLATSQVIDCRPLDERQLAALCAARRAAVQPSPPPSEASGA